MIYAVENLTNCLDEMNIIARDHYKEAAPYDDIKLNVDWNHYIEAEKHGYFKFYTVRDEGKLVGYGMFFLSNSVEYSDSYQASMSNFFIHKSKRGYGAKFILWCDKQLKDLGVQVVYHHVKARNDYGILLCRLGYEKMNIEYSKRLDRE